MSISVVRVQPDMLEVSNLRSGYDGIPVLAGLSVSVAEREFVGILGHNGMGKTTLLKTLAGELSARTGTVTYGY